MERVKCTIIRIRISNKLQLEIFLAIIYISNLLSISSLNSLSLFDTSIQILPNLQYLCILGSIVFVFIHEKERNIKSAKWVSRGKRRILIGYDGGTIYRIYLHDKAKTICIKDLKIFENTDEKEDSQVTSYKAIIASRN